MSEYLIMQLLYMNLGVSELRYVAHADVSLHVLSSDTSVREENV